MKFKESENINIGISSCLLGESVRFDGGHKYNKFICESLGHHFKYIPCCPELAIGLGKPRPPIRLVDNGKKIMATATKIPGSDYTEALFDLAKKKARDLHYISGYIFKKGSPSCGAFRVKLYNTDGIPCGKTQGIFASRLMEALPLLPVEEEGRLNDPALRESFIERVYTYHRWQLLIKSGISPHKLIKFHSDHKFILLSHDEQTYRRLGKLVASVTKVNIEQLATDYFAALMKGLKKPTTPKKHANVMMHIMGYLKRELNQDNKQELLSIIDQYRNGFVPLIAPLTLLRHWLRKLPNTYLERQSYLTRYPVELGIKL